MMGVRQTNTFLERTTWTLAALVVVLSIASAYTMPKAGTGVETRTQATSAPAPAAPGSGAPPGPPARR